MAARGRGLFSQYIYIEKFKNLFVRNQMDRFQYNLAGYQDCWSHHDSSKNMAARGPGIFSLYIYIENFKNLLVRNRWIEFSVTWQECWFGDLLPRLHPHDTSKNMAVGGRGLFSVYIYIENFKKIFS